MKLSAIPTPWRILGIGIAGILALAALVWGVNHMLGQAKQAGRDEVQARWDAEKAGAEAARAAFSEEMASALSSLDISLQDAVQTIRVKGHDITVRVKEEMQNEPRYSSPDCAVTGGVRDGINAARRLSHPASSSPVREGGVPSSGAAVRLEFGDPGS